MRLTPHIDRGGNALRRRVVIPAQLTREQRAALTQRLYEVHQRIFAGVSVESFHRHVVEPSAEATVIQLYVADDERIVGYCAFHRFRRRIRGRDVIVLRAEAGLVPGRRGRGMTYGFGIVRAILERFRHPFTPIYYLGTLVHPSSYHLFCKYFSRVFPLPERETPTDMLGVARDLADSFADPPVRADDPYVRDVGWITVETPQEKALNRRGNQPDVEFFKQRNPGYERGHGLVVVVPITFGNIFGALLARLLEQVRLSFGRRQPDL